MNYLAKDPSQLHGSSFCGHVGTPDLSERMQIDALHSTVSEISQLLGAKCPKGAVDEQVFLRRRLKAGKTLYAAGQRFEGVCVVRSGFFKTSITDEAGNEQVLGFPMKGDFCGLDGIYDDCYPSRVVALTESEVITIPIKNLATLGLESPELKYLIYRVLSRELVREHAVLSLLGTLGAEARVARFLIMLSERFMSLGFSPFRFNLRMTRQEIGSYLGLTLETVSRAFSALKAANLIRVNQKAIEIESLDALRAIATASAPAPAKPSFH